MHYRRDDLVQRLRVGRAAFPVGEEEMDGTDERGRERRKCRSASCGPTCLYPHVA